LLVVRLAYGKLFRTTLSVVVASTVSVTAACCESGGRDLGATFAGCGVVPTPGRAERRVRGCGLRFDAETVAATGGAGG
jgi:hypothetical protein